MQKKKLLSILILLLVYVFTTGASYGLFQQTSQKVVKALVPKNGEKLAFDPSLPKTQTCPLNGRLYSTQQRAWWERHRPLTVMIENHEESRPQSGLSFADVMYEAVAEGGITRFLAVFYCQDANPIGPVRSARTYFLEFVSEYGNSPLYAHVGGANAPGPADALSQIEEYGWVGYNDLNQFSIGFPTFWRDYDRLGHTVATEHTMYSTTTKLWNFAKSRGLTQVDEEGVTWDEDFVSYTFKDDKSKAQRGNNKSIHIEFWEKYKQYRVDWTYDKENNIYKRNIGGTAHLDKNTNKQLTAKNIVILYMQESNAYDGYENNIHLLYKTKGSGKALVFMDGEKVTGTWKKASRTDKTLFFDATGDEIQFNRGVLWFEILPLDGVVAVKEG